MRLLRREFRGMLQLRYVLRCGAGWCATGFGLLMATSIPAGENLIEPGQWKVTSTTVINGVAQPSQAKGRCISAEQAADVAKTFGPVSGTINSTCDAPDIKTTERTLSWRLTCRGQLDADVAGEFNFDTPQHYTAMVTSQGRMAGALISDVKTGLEGERIGDCQP
jgi:Protein of unknown function (DUF3617)